MKYFRFATSHPIPLKRPPLRSRPSCLLISCHGQQRVAKSSTRVIVKSVTFLQPPLENAEGPERKRLSGAPEAINQLPVTQRWQGQGPGWDRHSAFKPPTHWLTDTYCGQTLDNVAFYFLLGYTETLGFAHNSKIIRCTAVPFCSRPPRFNKEELVHNSLVCRSTAKAILFFLALDKWMLELEIFAKLNFFVEAKNALLQTLHKDLIQYTETMWTVVIQFIFLMQQNIDSVCNPGWGWQEKSTQRGKGSNRDF